MKPSPGVSRQDDLDPAVGGAAGDGGVAGNRLGLAEALGVHAGRVDLTGGQEAGDAVRALFREDGVVAVGADRVGVAINSAAKLSKMAGPPQNGTSLPW